MRDGLTPQQEVQRRVILLPTPCTGRAASHPHLRPVCAEDQRAVDPQLGDCSLYGPAADLRRVVPSLAPGAYRLRPDMVRRGRSKCVRSPRLLNSALESTVRSSVPDWDWALTEAGRYASEGIRELVASDTNCLLYTSDAADE